MGHHINEKGEFQSDKHPELPPDRIRLNLANPRSERALRRLAEDYLAEDPELAADIDDRLNVLHGPHRRVVHAEIATQEKGYPHPGNYITLPRGGGVIFFQYGHPQEVGENGCFMHEVVQALIDHLSVYQQEGHPLACGETDATIKALTVAKETILARRQNRQERGVHQTDKP